MKQILTQEDGLMIYDVVNKT